MPLAKDRIEGGRVIIGSQLFIVPSSFPSYSLFIIEIFFDIIFLVKKSGAFIFSLYS